MRAVIQRVSRAQVAIDGLAVGEIGPGLVALIGIADSDTETDAAALADKIANLRVFDDDAGIMNLSVVETGRAILAVSQFTIMGDVRKGRRPSYAGAASPESARSLYGIVVEKLKAFGIEVKSGTFQAMMTVSLVNEGPVTILLDTKRQF